MKETKELDAFLSRQGTDELQEDLVKARIVIAGLYDVADEFNVVDWHKDVPLKDVSFYKVWDPYQAYQELDMYISGVLGQQEKETINISDKDRIYQHGFDSYSFRKLPEEKKRG